MMKHSRWQRVVVAIIIFLLLQALTFGQDSFVAIPPARASRYKIDFARNFFISPEDAPPEVLLKRHLNLDLNDPRLFSNALSVIRNKIVLLEKVYQK